MGRIVIGVDMTVKRTQVNFQAIKGEQLLEYDPKNGRNCH